MPPAPAPTHLLIADAGLPAGTPGPTPDTPGTPGAQAPHSPTLPHLQALVARMAVADTVDVADDGPATPLELALARAQHLPGAPGHVPWAAFDSGTVGTPCAWLRPCHWQLGLDQVNLLDPRALALTDAESRALHAAVQPLLAEDGIDLRYVAPQAWLAEGALFAGLTTWSMPRAVTHPLTPALLALAPTPAQSAHLRRLQTELQMLLYNHPVNNAREAARQWPVNAVWIDGAGALDAPAPPNPQVRVATALADLPFGDDPHANAAEHQAAWQAIDAGDVAQLRQALDAGADVRLTLCGPRRAVTLAPVRGTLQRIFNVFSRLRLQDVREQL